MNRQQRASADDDLPIVPPPSTMTVTHDPKPILYTADGKPLARQCGYVSMPRTK